MWCSHLYYYTERYGMQKHLTRNMFGKHLFHLTFKAQTLRLMKETASCFSCEMKTNSNQIVVFSLIDSRHPVIYDRRKTNNLYTYIFCSFLADLYGKNSVITRKLSVRVAGREQFASINSKVKVKVKKIYVDVCPMFVCVRVYESEIRSR